MLTTTCSTCWKTTHNLREFVKTTVILAPGAWGSVGCNCTIFPKAEECREYREYREYRENSGRLIWHYNYNGFGTFWPENDFRFSCNFDSQGRIYLKVESTILTTFEEFWFSGPNLAKNRKSSFHKSSSDFLTPSPRVQRAPWESPGVQRLPKEVQRALQDLFRRPNLYIQTPDQPQSGHYL